jgi:hypothetical protein
MSPLGQFAVRVAGPRLTRWTRYVAGPPKRFAQGLGLAFTATSSIVTLTSGFSVGRWILVPLIGAASLEGFAGFCLGCTVFGWLIRAGLIPASVCEDCGDLTRHYAQLAE